MFAKLDLKNNLSTTILTSIIYSKFSSVLEKKGKKELFGFIKSIKVNNGKVTIKTGKPIVNAELSNFSGDFKEETLTAYANFGLIYKEIKISFL